MLVTTIPWQHPLEIASKIASNYNDDWLLLYSGLHQNNKDSYSYIALFSKQQIKTNNWQEAKKILEHSTKDWFGYLAYENICHIENIIDINHQYLQVDNIFLQNFAVVLQFSHQQQQIFAQYDSENLLQELQQLISKTTTSATKPQVTTFESNFDDSQYLQAIASIQQKIANGDFFQTNLTRKFYGELDIAPTSNDAFALFQRLTQLSPANYSSFLSFNKLFVISASPELFLQVSANKVTTRPIKGTIASNPDPTIDQLQKQYLANSIKERAENLMITDLMRNDLSRVCYCGSVKVSELFAIYSYKNLHHMVSEVCGHLRAKNYDLIEACFPPGSMTGAPKLEAIKVAQFYEKINRGIYSGCIGLFSQEKLNLSVVIRTLIISNNKFEFQAGGAITSDSDPQQELQEVNLKASAIKKLLYDF